MKNDGGPAFPQSETANGNTIHDEHAQGGMSLRDYFAAKAMAAVLERIPAMPNARIADQAYGIADAMIAARSKETDGE